MKRILLVICLVLMELLFYLPKASATNLPTYYTIVRATGYQNLAETGDMFVLAELNIAYTTYPVEAVDQTWIVRWMSGTTELANIVPFNNPYFNNGYGRSVTGLYLSAADVVSMNVTYQSNNYTISLERNPSATWNGTPPEPTVYTPISWTATTKDMRDTLRIRILQLASDFRSYWSLTFNLQESGSLTSYGENYFTGAITNLRLLCPQVFSSFITSPTFRRRTFSLSYALTLRNQWVGTWLDMTSAAADWGIDPIWLYGGLWTLVLFAAVWGVSAISNSNRGIYWTVTMGIGVGSFLGFYPWAALGIDAVVAVLVIVNETLYKRSPA